MRATIIYNKNNSKNNRYSRKIRFILDKKQVDSFSFITGGSNFVSAPNCKKKKY